MGGNEVMNAFISVILPLYNAEKYILSAINSVLIQEKVEFELIVIDDGSTDNSVRIVESISDPRLRFYKKENGGIISALNLALSISTGSIIARMDADDIMEPCRLSKQLDFLAKNKLDVVGSFIKLINENGLTIGSKDFPVKNCEIISALPFFNPICHPSTMMKKEVLIEAGGYSVGTDGAEDFDLWCKLSRKHRLGNIPEYLLRYRLTPQSLSRTSFDQRMKLCRNSIRLYLGPTTPQVFYSVSDYFRKPISILIYGVKYSFSTKFKSIWYVFYGLGLAIYSQIKFRKEG